MRRGHRAVDAYTLPGFHPRVTRHTQQAPVDALPGRRAYRAHRRRQRGLPRQARRVQSRKALCGTRVAQRELQPPTGLLAQIFEHRATQNRLAGQAVASPRRPRLGASGGAPSAIQFAARHPDRTSAPLLACAISQRYVNSTPTWMWRVLLSPAFVRLQNWAIGRFPRAGIEAILRMESTFDAPERKRIATEMANSPEVLGRLSELWPIDSRAKDSLAGLPGCIAWRTRGTCCGSAMAPTR